MSKENQKEDADYVNLPGEEEGKKIVWKENNGNQGFAMVDAFRPSAHILRYQRGQFPVHAKLAANAKMFISPQLARPFLYPYQSGGNI